MINAFCTVEVFSVCVRVCVLPFHIHTYIIMQSKSVKSLDYKEW